MTSTDGFCSVITFTPGELGERYVGPPAGSSTTPTPTPTSSATASTPSVVTPAKIAPSSLPPLSPAPPPTRHPGSPARSSSASSVASLAHPHSVNNPTPTVGSIPGVATSAGGVPLSTPPQTPQSGGGSQMPTPAPVKRGLKTEGEDVTSASEQEEVIEGDKKRRRIAPTPVTDAELLKSKDL